MDIKVIGPLEEYILNPFEVKKQLRLVHCGPSHPDGMTKLDLLLENPIRETIHKI